MAVDPTLTMDELRSKLQLHLKKSGALTNLKTQLRAMVLTEVTGQKLNESNQQQIGPYTGSAASGGIVSKGGGHGGGVGARNAYASRLADEMVEAHLRGTFRSFSHSIFTSEANIDGGGNSNSAYGRDADLALALDIPFAHHDPQQYTSTHSLLSSLVERCLKRRSQRALVNAGGNSTNPTTGVVTAGTITLYDFQDCACQTSESELLINGPFPSYHTLEQKLSLVDAEHALRQSHVHYATSASLEQRMKQHKEELDIIMQRELERKYQQFRAKELGAVRAEEYEKYQNMLRFKEEEKREFERSVEYRMQLERERIEHLKIDLAMQKEAMEKRGHDVMALSREREQSATYLERALEEKKGAMQKVQAQLSRMEEICAQRSDEIETYKTREGRRLAEMQRQQRDHLSELKMRDDEIAETRYRLKVVAEEYKQNIERLTTSFSGGGGRHDRRTTFEVTAAQQIAASNHNDDHHQPAPSSTSNPAVDALLTKYDANRGNQGKVAPSSSRLEMTSVPISTTASKYLRDSNEEHDQHHNIPTTKNVTTASSAGHLHHHQQHQLPETTTTTAVTAIASPKPRKTSSLLSASPTTTKTATATNNHNIRPTSPLPHREKKPSPTASVSSASIKGDRSRSPAVSQVSLSASPIGHDASGLPIHGGSDGMGRGESSSRSSISTAPSSPPSSTSNKRKKVSSAHRDEDGGVVVGHDHITTTPNTGGKTNKMDYSSPSPSVASSTPSSSSRKPIVDKNRCKAICAPDGRPCKTPATDHISGLCELHKSIRDEISLSIKALQSEDESSARITLLRNEGMTRLELISGYVLGTMLNVGGPLAVEEDTARKQLLWSYNKGMETLRIARAAAKGGAASSGGGGGATTYGGGALVLSRDSDDSSDDVGLFKNGSDDDSDF